MQGCQSMAQFCTPRPKQDGLGCQANSLEKGQWFPTQGSLTAELMPTVLHILLIANQTYLGHCLQMVGLQLQLEASPAQNHRIFGVRYWVSLACQQIWCHFTILHFCLSSSQYFLRKTNHDMQLQQLFWFLRMNSPQ